MAHLFLASKTSTLDAKVPAQSAMKTQTPAENLSQNKSRVVLLSRVPHVNELQLTAATGGAEMSCNRCIVPFAVVVLIAGIVVTVVAYTFNSHGSNISLLGLVMLSAGLFLLGSSALCWRLRGSKKPDKRRESQTALLASQGYCVA
ncbi:hypothetical protein CgunFtcFv8_001410 [Champsocephalus gunnari]|uniref:Transmembrane protein 100 n=1 Tax=Champsocephalus gunnari TaxID=52237 RepID=A0AAN8CJR7_CHAGU|nr:hypothetical protein CgunFtcFv8_001410 [Champsocephalus gunnari]